jgi:hypothetical protein
MHTVNRMFHSASTTSRFSKDKYNDNVIISFLTISRNCAVLHNQESRYVSIASKSASNESMKLFQKVQTYFGHFMIGWPSSSVILTFLLLIPSPRPLFSPPLSQSMNSQRSTNDKRRNLNVLYCRARLPRTKVTRRGRRVRGEKRPTRN